jgi:hypothetical protein
LKFNIYENVIIHNYLIITLKTIFAITMNSNLNKITPGEGSVQDLIGMFNAISAVFEQKAKEDKASQAYLINRKIEEKKPIYSKNIKGESSSIEVPLNNGISTLVPNLANIKIKELPKGVPKTEFVKLDNMGVYYKNVHPGNCNSFIDGPPKNNTSTVNIPNLADIKIKELPKMEVVKPQNIEYLPEPPVIKYICPNTLEYGWCRFCKDGNCKAKKILNNTNTEIISSKSEGNLNDTLQSRVKKYTMVLKPLKFHMVCSNMQKMGQCNNCETKSECTAMKVPICTNIITNKFCNRCQYGTCNNVDTNGLVCNNISRNGYCTACGNGTCTLEKTSIGTYKKEKLRNDKKKKCTNCSTCTNTYIKGTKCQCKLAV